MQDTIQEIYVNNRKDGGVYWTILLSDGERYSIFNTDIGNSLAQGQTYEFTVMVKGQYKNIIKAELIEDVNADMQTPFDPPGKPEPGEILIPPQTAPSEKPIEHTSPAPKAEMPFQNNPINKDEAIARSVALKCATAYLNELPGGYTPSELGAVVSMAQRFFTYLTTGV